MRFCLVSTHTDQTIGYSKIATNLLKQLSIRAAENEVKDKVKIFHFGFQRHAARANIKRVPNGVVSYDASANEDPKEEGFGYNKFKEYLEMVQPDVVMIYNDILTISKFLDAMMADPKADPKEKDPPQMYNQSLKPNFKIWLYLDVMYQGMHPMLLRKVFQITDRIYVFSKSAMTQMKAYDDKILYGTLPEIVVMEHAVDPEVFHVVRDTKLINRRQLGVPSDAILFLNCNRNSQRKRLDLSIMAFAQLLKKLQDSKNNNKNVPEVYFAFATGGVAAKPGNTPFYDIPRMYFEEMKKLGYNETEVAWKKRLVLIDTSVNVITDEGINELYNLCDIGVNTSTGEGFGLCTFEHMVSSGAAQIVTDTGCYSEYLSVDKNADNSADLALIVKKSGHGYFDVTQAAFGFEFPVFNLDDIVNAYEDCVLNLEKWKKRSEGVKNNLKSWEEATSGLWADILKVK
jgi:glycosyltransferase involved in cell wall biosynthesis